MIVSPFFAKPEMYPSDFRSKKLATGFDFGCPRSSCVRPVSVLRYALQQGLPQMTWMPLVLSAPPLPLPRLPCTPSQYHSVYRKLKKMVDSMIMIL